MKEYEFLADDIRLTYRGERHFTAARGSLGGGEGAMSKATIYRAKGQVEVIASKIVTTVSKGIVWWSKPRAAVALAIRRNARATR